MSGKANASKKKTQKVKRISKRRIDEEVELAENEVRNTAKRNKRFPKLPSSEGIEQAKHIKLKQIKIASSKRTTWQPLPKNTREHLQNMMESVILLLQQCQTLKVPPRKLTYLTNVSDLLKKEVAQERANEESRASLQEEIDKIVETTESMTENIQSLKNKIQILTQEVEEEEEKVKEVFHMDSNRVLSLPELSQKSLKAPTLQNEILTLIPNPNALLMDLDVLHNSSPMKTMSAFIQKAYEKLDGF
ncbi:centromere protein Q isoform X2 [Nannospalax galili]|uniref:centromere protein Q isoform X2 n=1 Tax=Nannospalax galili TaxID=1026970 RepID=UPI00111BFC9E|nr:centromere protein Q isoform X2 [Nannospalax galili]